MIFSKEIHSFLRRTGATRNADINIYFTHTAFSQLTQSNFCRKLGHA